MSEPLTEWEDGYDAGVVQGRYLAALTAEEVDRVRQIAETAPDTEIGRLFVRFAATLVTLRETLAYIADWAHDRTVAADPDAKDEHGFATVEARCRKALGG